MIKASSRTSCLRPLWSIRVSRKSSDCSVKGGRIFRSNRRRRTLNPLFAALFGLALVVAAQVAQATAPNVAYDIAEDGDHYLRSALINIDNQVEAARGGHIDMVVVMHGAGIALARKAKDNADLRTRIAALKRAGVSFRVCAATLAQRHLDYRRDLYDVHAKDLVPNGVAELVRLQQLEFVYIKP